jgi:hypothetical protein
MRQKAIDIKCDGSALLPLSSLQPLQGGLKELSKEDYVKLRSEISTRGFCFPVFVWQNGGQNFIIDGHQRVTALKQMLTEGYGIPEMLPCVTIRAPDADTAKRLILSASSRYGKITEDGLYEFLEGFDGQIDWEDLMSTLDIPEIDLEKFEEGFISDPGSPEGAEPVLPEKMKITLLVDHKDYSSFYQQLAKFIKGFPGVSVDMESA